MHELDPKFLNNQTTEYPIEVSLAIGDSSAVLGTASGDSITVGGTEILLNTGGIEGGYGFDRIYSLRTNANLFAAESMIGNCIAKQLETTVVGDLSALPAMSGVRLFVRYRADDGEYSDWLPKGVYHIDTRQVSLDSVGNRSTSLTAYDGMLLTEADFHDNLDWDAADIDVFDRIVSQCGLAVAPGTREAIDQRYTIPYQPEYSCRELLGYIAGMYGGNFVMDDYGRLKLILLADVTGNTDVSVQYLVNELGEEIMVGGEQLIV